MYRFFVTAHAVLSTKWEMRSLSALTYWRRGFVAICLLLLLAACGAEPEPTPVVTLLATATQPPTQPPTQTLVSALPTATVTMAAQSPVTPTQVLTATTTPTVAAAMAEELALACTQETDIALASYPDLHQLMGCALGPAIFDPVGINEFGTEPPFDRFMLWFSHEVHIYTLLPDKRWQAYADTWTEEQPTFACNPMGGAEESPPLPRRGFGKLWCENAELQAAMGTVAKEERLCQHTVLQPFQYGRLLACYEDATIRYFRIMDDGSWDQLLVQ